MVNDLEDWVVDLKPRFAMGEDNKKSNSYYRIPEMLRN